MPAPTPNINYPVVPAKTIVTRAKSSGWFGMNYNMNIYRGCSHGCIYCDSRSDCYRDPDFDTVKVKKDALRIIRDDLRRKVKPGVVATGAMSDPYNPLEAELKITRNALELLNAYGFGIAIDTKSPLVVRDIDILKDIAEHSPVLVKVTITTADDALSRRIEPHVAPSSARFAALHRLADAGIFCGVLLMPLLPYLTDTEENIREIVRRASESGARFVYPSFGVTMRDGQREYFCTRLEEIRPGLGTKYLSRFGTRYHCPSPNKALWDCFKEECGRLGLLYNMRDIVSGYKMGYGDAQLTFFD